MQDDGRADPVHGFLVAPVLRLHAAVDHRPVGEDGGEPLVFQGDRDARESLLKDLQEGVHVGLGLGGRAIHVHRITHHKAFDCLLFGVIFEIIY